ncbi:class I SAM-dependent methyltransferase [Herbihabitans rhizosphaerae]|nr:class I SAM-dependent methyltransferase [Herbihabitans rhizosphaerae]
MVGTAQREVGSLEAQAASITWWDADADAYHGEHGEFLGTADFVWCPEALREQDARLLGEVRGRDVLEVGCGSAPCSRWLAGQGARPVAFDLSAGMLRYARAGNASSGIEVPLVRANAERIPFADASFDLACSAFGAVPFVSDLHRLHREVARVLRPGGTWTFAVNHPMRWIFPDVPGPVGMTVTSSYFDRTPYLEVDADGRATYVEYHRTMGDHVEAITSAGLALERLIEPEWPDGLTREWGQWTPERGAMFPGTVIFLCRKGRT